MHIFYPLIYNLGNQYRVILSRSVFKYFSNSNSNSQAFCYHFSFSRPKNDVKKYHSMSNHYYYSF